MSNYPEKIYEEGTPVVTHAELGSTKGFLIAEKHIEARKPNTKGTINYPVPGHGGDVYFVTHDDGTCGAYGYDEFDLLGKLSK